MSATNSMEFLAEIPFVDHLGFELLGLPAGGSELAIDLRPEFTNAWGVAHGGLLMTMLDIAMAHAARSPLADGGEVQPSVATIEMKTSFMRPAEGRLLAHGRRIHRTASLAFCEGTVTAADGTPLCHGTGTFKYLRGMVVGGRRVARPDASD